MGKVSINIEVTKIIIFFEELKVPLIIRTEVSFIQRCVETRLQLANWFWRRKVLNFIKCIFAISILSFLKKRQILHLNELESYFILTRGYFLSSLAEIGPVVLDFGLFFLFISLLGKGHGFILKKPNSIYSRILCAVFG